MPIYLLHYPNGDNIKKSEGLIKRITENNYTLEHLCKCDCCSSGGPLINFNNNKVIGIHKGFGNGKKWNYGVFIKAPIERFKEKNSYIENNQNLNEENNINNNYFMNNMNMNMNNFMNMNNMNNMNNNFMNMNNMNNNFMNINNNMNNINFNNNMNNINMNNMNFNNNMNNMNFYNNMYNMNMNNNENNIIFEEPGADFLVKISISSGLIVTIKISKNASLKKLFKIFCKNVGITENYCENDIIFLFNGSKLDFNSKNKLKTLSKFNSIKITAFDKNGLLPGQLIITFCTTLGNRKVIKVSKFITVSELIKIYINDIGIEENLIENKIVFLYNAQNLNKLPNEKLNTLMKDKAIISVIDLENMIETIKDYTFNASSGTKKIIKASPMTTMKHLIKKYKEEIEFYESSEEVEKLIFLFNGLRLDPKSNEKIGKLIKSDKPTITVVDNDNIINN